MDRNQPDIARLGNWLYGWIQPNGALYGFHNHSVWGDNPLRWWDGSSGHSTFAAPMLAGLAAALAKQSSDEGLALLRRMVDYQAACFREDGEFRHIGFQVGETAQTGLIHNMVPVVALGLCAEFGTEFLGAQAMETIKNAMLHALTSGASLHYGGGRATATGCCNQEYARIWAKLLYGSVFGDSRFSDEVLQDLDFMAEHFLRHGVPGPGCAGAVRGLSEADCGILEPAEYYGLMIAPLCLAHKLFGRPTDLHTAKALAGHILQSAWRDTRGRLRAHRLWFKNGAGWEKLESPMLVAGFGLTLYALEQLAALSPREGWRDFVLDYHKTLGHYQTGRGFMLSATGWDCEADIAPSTAWHSHDFFHLAADTDLPLDFWERFFAPCREVSVVLGSQCIWLEDASRWSIQDYFTQSRYNHYGRKDAAHFWRDMAWTGGKSNIDKRFLWRDMPRFVKRGDGIYAAGNLPADCAVYNFSGYEYRKP